MKKKKDATKFDLLALSEFEKIAEISWVKVSDGCELRILRSSTESKETKPFTLVLIAGWASIIMGWNEVLMEAKKHFNVVYIETREKGTSKVTKDSIFDAQRFTLDIKEIFEFLHLDQNRVVVLSSSFSSMLVAYMLSHKMISPFLSVFIGPIERIPLPRSIRILLTIFPIWLYAIVKPIGIFWVKHFKAEDEYHAAKYARAIIEGDPLKWKKTSKHFFNKLFWDSYAGFDNQVLVVDESVDRMHDTEMTQKINEIIKNSIFLDLKTNKNTHSKPIIDIILKYMQNSGV